jgi:methyl-accepting chemotaxis protein
VISLVSLIEKMDPRGLSFLGRLRVAFWVVSLYAIVLFAVVVQQHRSSERDYQRVRLCQVASASINALRRDDTRGVLDPGATDDVMAHLTLGRERFQSSFDSYRSLLLSDSERSNLEQTQSLAQDYFSLEDRLLDMAHAGQRDGAVRLLLGSSLQAFQVLNDSVTRWAEPNEPQGGDSLQAYGWIHARGMTTVMVMTFLVLLTSVVAPIFLSHIINESMRAASLHTKRVAAGDLTQRLSVKRNDELSAVLDALNEMTSQLSNLISEVVGSAQSVRVTASELAGSNNELNERTHRQAQTVRQTAAAMEQIAALAKNNSDHAAGADRLGQQARELAASSGEIVSQAVRAMDVINAGGAKISNITSMIDEIAFQTNLLALNAAVEAARAGEHGRGFAVVATEVRALAQRSADAAKQIKALIRDSADSISTGTELVNRSGGALTQIQRSVREITTLVNQIASSSREQADGARRIGDALVDLDRTTQENAQLVEHGSAAARNLRAHAAALTRHATFFTVNEASAESLQPQLGAEVTYEDESSVSPVRVGPAPGRPALRVIPTSSNRRARR